MYDINARIETMLIRFLKAEHGIDATVAKFDETYSGISDGCDTCGYGADGMSFDILYKDSGGYYKSISVDGDPLEFFPVLLSYDDTEQ